MTTQTRGARGGTRPVPADDGSPSGTLQRGIAILELLADGTRPTVGELMTSLDLSRSAAYRIVGVLREHGLVDWDSTATGPVSLGSATILLGMTALAQSDAWEAGRGLMRDLADRVGESVLMAVVDGGEIVYVAHEDRGDHVVGVRRLLGVRRPLQVTSLGKAYAAALGDDHLAALADGLRYAPGTPTTVTSREEFLADVRACRARGYAVDDGEQDVDVMCLGAAVLDHRELPTSAISIAGPCDRIAPRRDELAAEVVAVARAISLRLGCPPTAYAPTSTRTTLKGKS